MEIDYDARLSPHQQIAAWIVGLISDGTLQKGARIPSEKDIVDETGVARTTARRAVKALREMGVVETVPGRGSFVR